MEKITLKFSVREFPISMFQPTIILSMDENGKKATIDISDCPLPFEVEDEMSKRVMKAFNETAINKLLALDEIPENEDIVLSDGNHYTIEISKGKLSKIFHADEASIDYCPLLSYLASWYRRHVRMVL